jgi:hypothetical protein
MTNAFNLIAVKLIHTLVWLFMVSVIFYILYCGLVNDITVYTWIASGLIVVEGLVLLIFGGRCPLTIIARNYSASNRDNFDIFLPNWLARYNKLLFTTLYVIGMIIVAYRLYSAQ